MREIQPKKIRDKLRANYTKASIFLLVVLVRALVTNRPTQQNQEVPKKIC